MLKMEATQLHKSCRLPNQKQGPIVVVSLVIVEGYFDHLTKALSGNIWPSHKGL